MRVAAARGGPVIAALQGCAHCSSPTARLMVFIPLTCLGPRPPRVVQAMSRPCYNAIGTHAPNGKPALVFVPTRKHARLTALDMLTYAAADGEPGRFRLLPEADLEPYLARIKVRSAARAHTCAADTPPPAGASAAAAMGTALTCRRICVCA